MSIFRFDDLPLIPYTGDPIVDPAHPDVRFVGFRVEHHPDEPHPTYWYEFAGVDRPVSRGVMINRKHAARLEAAMLAGRLVSNVRTLHTNTDPSVSYAQFDTAVPMGKYANSDLARIGF